jgi:hypothetical protein
MYVVSGGGIYVVTRNGVAVPAPDDWEFTRTRDPNEGTIFQKPGSSGKGNGQGNSVRIMQPGKSGEFEYSSGRFGYTNAQGQPLTGKQADDGTWQTGEPSETHFSLDDPAAAEDYTRWLEQEHGVTLGGFPDGGGSPDGGGALREW